jgi:hypothetical protein
MENAAEASIVDRDWKPTDAGGRREAIARFMTESPDRLLSSLLVAMLACMACLSFGGCASTSITLPDGSQYSSSKDVQFSGVEYEMFYPNGQPQARLKIDGGAGSASRVNEAGFAALGKVAEKLPSLSFVPGVGVVPVAVSPVAPAAVPARPAAPPGPSGPSGPPAAPGEGDDGGEPGGEPR